MKDEKNNFFGNLKQKINIKKITNIEFLITIFLLISPAVDVLTSFTRRFTLKAFSVGQIVRVLFLVIIGLYFIFKTKNSKLKKSTLIYFVLVAIYSLVSMLNLNKIYAGKGFGVNIKNIFRIFYFPVMTVLMLNIFLDDKFKIEKKLLVKVGLLYGLLIFIPTTMGVYFRSYGNNPQRGTNGLFYGANETSIIFSILSLFTYIYFIKNKITVYSFASLFMSIYATFYIGTKVPVYSFVCSILFLIIYFIFNVFIMKKYTKNEKKDYFKKFLLILLSALIIFPTSPFSDNYFELRGKLKLPEFANEQKEKDEKTAEEKIVKEEYSIKYRKYFKEITSKRFNRQSKQTKALGMGMYNSLDEKDVKLNDIDESLPEIFKVQKMVEIDFYDIFYSTGYLGFIVFAIPMISILGYVVVKSILNFKKVVIDTSIVSKVFLILLTTGISFMAGHAFLAPSVSIFLSIMLANLVYELNEIIKKTNIR